MKCIPAIKDSRRIGPSASVETQGETCHVVSYRRCDSHHLKGAMRMATGTHIHFLKDLRARLKFFGILGKLQLLFLAVLVLFPQLLLAQWNATIGAQSDDLGRQALAFLPNEIWIHASRSLGPWQTSRDTPLPSSPAARYGRPLRSSVRDFLRLPQASTAPAASRVGFCSRVTNSRSFFRWQGTSSWSASSMWA